MLPLQGTARSLIPSYTARVAANPEVVEAIRYATQGVFGMVTEAVKGRAMARWATPPPEEGVVGFEGLEAFPALPSLDEARLGDSIGVRDTAAVIPDDLFADVVGLDHEKALLRTCWTSGSRLHCLMVGPPGSAKSLLMDELRRLPRTRHLVLGATTAKGLRDLLLDGERPRLVLIEEIEKSDQAVRQALLTAMDGLVTKDVHGAHEEVDEIDTRFVAAANSTRGLSDALLSRFVILEMRPYTAEERHAVIRGFLTTRHHLDEATAEEIAALVAPHGGDVRDAEQIATVWATDPDLARAQAARLRTAGRGA